MAQPHGSMKGLEPLAPQPLHNPYKPTTLFPLIISMEGLSLPEMAASGAEGKGGYSIEEAAEYSCGFSNCDKCNRRRSMRLSPLSLSLSCFLLSFNSYSVQDYDNMWRVFMASIKGFAISTGLKDKLTIFALLERLRRQQSLPLAW